jgi:hypothetical protein
LGGIVNTGLTFPRKLFKIEVEDSTAKSGFVPIVVIHYDDRLPGWVSGHPAVRVNATIVNAATNTANMYLNVFHISSPPFVQG